MEVGPATPDILVDPDRMTQVLGNLVSNALRHTPAGGRITLSAERRSDGVQLAVRDSGEGIPQEALPHVFDRFYRGDAARRERDGEAGSGLGLAIAQSLVEMHGGTISVRGRRASGTTFTIVLHTA